MYSKIRNTIQEKKCLNDHEHTRVCAHAEKQSLPMARAILQAFLLLTTAVGSHAFSAVPNPTCDRGTEWANRCSACLYANQEKYNATNNCGCPAPYNYTYGEENCSCYQDCYYCNACGGDPTYINPPNEAGSGFNEAGSGFLPAGIGFLGRGWDGLDNLGGPA